jgi:hypothetical protein
VASVRVVRENGHALVEIVDDGIGGSDSSRAADSEDSSIVWKALDGRLDPDSPTGAGICIRADPAARRRTSPVWPVRRGDAVEGAPAVR